MTRLFIGNFSFSVDDDQLREYFSKVGTVVAAKVMKEGQGGRSRGFGFIEYASAEEAQKAIKELDGGIWDGRPIKVSEDRSFRRGGAGGAEGGHHHHDSHSGGERGGAGEEGGENRPAPTGYFRAQPFDSGIRRRKKADPFDDDPTMKIDYKDPRLLMRFLSEKGRILPRRMTGLNAMNQRRISRAIKRCHQLGLLVMGRP